MFAGLLAAAVCARADQEQDLLAILKSNVDASRKCDACLKLRLAGTVKSVPALAALLTEERTGHAARYALEGLPYPEATTALREALGKASGSVQAGLIDSAGWRRDAKAVPLLQQALLGPDSTNAAAAACALGRVGDKKAASALTAAQKKVSPALQPAVQEGLLRCAEQLLAGGDAKGAAALYRNLSNEKAPDRIRVAAFRGLVLSDANSRAELVSKALTGQDRPLHLAALQVLREAKDAAVVEACASQWSGLPADAQLAVLDTQLKSSGEVGPVLLKASQSAHLVVRVAAWQAYGTQGDTTAIPALTQATVQGEPAEREAARESLASLNGPQVREAFYQQLAKAGPEEKVVLLRALGERGDTAAAKLLLENAAATQPEAVRLAALEALRKIAEPSTVLPLLTLAAKAKTDADCEPVLSALYVVCQASPNKDQTAQAVLEAIKPLPDDEARRVLPVLAELATPEALEAAQAAAQANRDPETAKAAVRVLAQWPTAAPANTLLALARTSTDPVLQVLASRGAITVAGQEPDNAKRLALLQQALTVAKRPEEKKQALGQFGQVATPEALQSAMGYLADAELANEAGLAAISIAEKLAPTQPDLAKDTAAKVLAQCNTPDIVKRAWAIRGKRATASPFIQDWLVSGPYSKPGVAGAPAVFDLVFPPEQPEAKAQWKPLPRAQTADLSGFFPGQANCVAYLKVRIIAPADGDATLLLGSDDGVKAWLNGAVVHSNNIDRGLVVDQDVAPIKLKKGANDLLLKVTQGGGGWAACARVVGSNGQPIKGLKYQADR